MTVGTLIGTTASTSHTPTPGISVPRPTAPVATPGPAPRPRLLSEADCRALGQRLVALTDGGGITTAAIWSTWTGNVRWARNRLTSSGETREDVVYVSRNLAGASGACLTNDVSEPGLLAAARAAERLAQLKPEEPMTDLMARGTLEPAAAPPLFSEATFQLGDGARAELARRLIQSAEAAGMLSAGYVEVSARCQALVDSQGDVRYFPYTWAQYAVTVRDPKGTGSGWAGEDHHDWAQIDGAKLSQLALEKCVKSQHPVRLEPGRYTAILEPQAVCDLVGLLVAGFPPPLGGTENEGNVPGPFWKRLDYAKLGERVIDARLTVSADPMDPELGFPPFDVQGFMLWPLEHPVYHATTWIKDGVLVNLALERRDAVAGRGRPRGQPTSGALRLSASGPVTSLDEMIAGTKRGLLVSRLNDVFVGVQQSLLATGVTRDGLWLVEDGKISKPVKNFRFTESPLFVLNNVEQIGPLQRVYHVPAAFPYTGYPSAFPQPALVPALKVREFSFTALSDAV